MNILIITQHIYPKQTPRAHRSTELAIELCRKGHDVTIYCVKGKYNYSQDEKFNGIEIKDIPTYFEIGKNTSDHESKRTFLDKVFSFFLERFFEFPTIEFLFSIPRKVKSEKKADLLISIAAPHPIHWGCAKWKKNSPQSFPKVWVSECGDPYLLNPSEKKPYFLRKLSNSAFKASDYITVPFEKAKYAYEKELHHKIRIIPQGFKFEQFHRQSNFKNTIPTFAFAGVFYPAIRNPTSFLEILSKINLPFQFIVYTPFPDLLLPFKNRLKEKLLIKKPIERAELLNELQKMDFLVSIENSKTPYQIPSKLIDYSIANRPILSVHPDKPNKNIIQEFLNGNYANEFIVHNLKQYKIENVATSFLNLISKE